MLWSDDRINSFLVDTIGNEAEMLALPDATWDRLQIYIASVCYTIRDDYEAALAAPQPLAPDEAVDEAFARAYDEQHKVTRRFVATPIDKSDALDDAFARLLGDTPHARPQDR